jgi:hypothetical protein
MLDDLSQLPDWNDEDYFGDEDYQEKLLLQGQTLRTPDEPLFVATKALYEQWRMVCRLAVPAINDDPTNAEQMHDVAEPGHDTSEMDEMFEWYEMLKMQLADSLMTVGYTLRQAGAMADTDRLPLMDAAAYVRHQAVQAWKHLHTMKALLNVDGTQVLPTDYADLIDAELLVFQKQFRAWVDLFPANASPDAWGVFG